MDARGGFREVALGSSITVQVLAQPRAEAIFLSTDAYGTPGRLNTQVLQQLGLPPDLPKAAELSGGYSFRRTPRGLVCYIVTVGGGPTGRALERHLLGALMTEELRAARSIWLPLMGTGDGRLNFDESFRITLEALRQSNWLDQPGVHATISLPGDLPVEAEEALATAIDRERWQAGTRPPDDEAEPELDQLTTSPAVDAALALAAELSAFRKQEGRRLSTTLLFFALAESQTAAAPETLTQDIAADFFAGAVREVLGDRYSQAWIDYFNTDVRPSGVPRTNWLPRPTPNVRAILHKASSLAQAAGVPAMSIDHLINALLEKEETRLLRLFEKVGIPPERLLKEYRNARLGLVAMKLRNDVASEEDRLGYDSYAQAITEFLTHADTPPPLSISIQAPWGGGKSSLMKLVRDKLDPKDQRDEHRPRIGHSENPLSLGSVLNFLDRKEPFEVNRSAPAKHLWTIWFNAWKYETSEQIWAGLVDSIISQIAERLHPLDREKFLLKLQLSRIDDGIVRRKIYDRIVTIWWSKARALLLAGAALTLSLLGLGAAAPKLPAEVAQAVSLTSGNPYAGGLLAPILISIYLVGSYFKKRSDIRNEPAAFSLAEYLRVPDYNKSVGEIHQIHADLRRVLGVVPRRTEEEEHSPIVIFIDDLDRCSPGKVASVVEGVSMLLASDTYRCMFVIGMDPQMVAAALEKAHEDVRKQLPRYERTVPLGWRFMDKFVQLPFTIPPATSERFKEYVMWLGDTVLAEPNPEEPSVVPPAPSISQREHNVRNENPDSGKAVSVDEREIRLISHFPRFEESRDVGIIIRKVATYSAGNPRELKRMVNLARFYLALRAARRSRDPNWRAPDLDQYARWIAITLRWPDMMRWLQWGADEAMWEADQLDQALTVRRLRRLEATALSSGSLDEWKAKLESDLIVPAESESDWACDPKLLEFFKHESAVPDTKRLSAAAGSEFW